MSNFPLKILFLLPVLLSQPALSQDVVGSTLLKGRTVELLDDKSWRYRDNDKVELDEKCETLKSHVVFCNSLDWGIVPPSGHVSAMYKVDGRNYVMFIIEPVGKADGVEAREIVDIVYKLAAEAMNIQQDSLPVHYVRTFTKGAYEYVTTAYTAKIKNLDFTFINNVYVGQQFSVQVVTYGVGQLNDSLNALNSQLLARVSFVEK